MVERTPIYCHKCSTYVGCIEDYQFMVIPTAGIKCPNCGETVIASNSLIFSTTERSK